MNNQVQILIYPSNHLVSGVSIDVNFVNNTIPITYQISDVRDLNSKSSSYTKQFKIPGTKQVNEIFSYIFEINNESEFNPNLKILCQVLQDGQNILQGYLQLKKINIDYEINTIEYEAVIYSANDNLVKQLSGVYMQDLDFSSYNHYFSSTTISGSWGYNTNRGGFVYPLADFVGKNWSKESISSPSKYINLVDLRPCIYLKNAVDAIFDYAGYTYTSDFFNSTRYKKIIMPLTNFVLPKERVEAHRFKAVTSGVSYFDSTSNQVELFDIVFEDDYSGSGTTTGGYDYSDNYNTSTGIYTFEYAFKGTVSMHLEYVVPTQLQAIVVSFALVVIRNGVTTYLYTSPQLVGGQTQLPIDITTSEFDFMPGDTLQLQAQRIYENITPFATFEFFDNSYIQLNLTDTIVYGSLVEVTNIMPNKIKAIDFLSSVFKVFNLHFEEDKANHKNIIIESRDDFYTNSEIVDWSSKLDISKSFEQTILPELQSKEILLTWSSDKDYFNNYYTTKKGENNIYGQKSIEVDNDFLKEDSKLTISNIFAPTPLTKIANTDIIISKAFKASDEGIAEPVELKPRLLYYGGLKQCSTYYIGAPGTPNPLISYPYAGHLDSPTNATFDLNFGTPEEIYYIDTLSGTVGYNEFKYINNNLYTNYWKNTIDEVVSPYSRLVSCYVYLKPIDIVNLSFRKTIFINGVNYKLNKIYNYNPFKSESTKVELIKSITNTPSTYQQDYRIAVPVDDDFSARINLGRNNNIKDPFNIIIGDNNSINSESEGNFILGENNIVHSLSKQAIITGYFNTGNTTHGIILGGSGNSMNYLNENTGIINGTDNIIESTGRTNSILIVGNNNTIGGNSKNSIIEGGSGNTISASTFSKISFGSDNIIKAGANNSIIIHSTGSYIGESSPDNNITSSQNSNIRNSSRYSSILNSKDSSVRSSHSHVQNSYNALIQSSYSSIVGGKNNSLENGSARYVTVINSIGSRASASYSSIINGFGHYLTSTANYSAIIGGKNFSGATDQEMVYVPNISAWNISPGGERMVTVDVTTGTMYYQNIPSFTGSTSGITSAVTSGAGISIIDTLSADTLYLKSLSAGTNITLADVNNNITINASVPIPGGAYVWNVGTGAFSMYAVNPALSSSFSNSQYSIVAGYQNRIPNNNSPNATILNGKMSEIYANANCGFIANGFINYIKYSTYCSVINGYDNRIYTTHAYNSNYSTILGGKGHKISNAGYSSILSGNKNYVSGDTQQIIHANILGGYNNRNGGTYSSIVNGKSNTISRGLTNVVIVNGNNISATTNDYVYVDKLNIQNPLSGGTYMLTWDNSTKNVYYQTIPVGASGSTSATYVQPGTNTYTGGTSTAPTVNVSALTINSLTVSGNTSLQSVSGTSLFSGSTNLSNLFVSSGSTNGSGTNVFIQKSNGVLQFKSLSAGTNITLTDTNNNITINASGGGTPTYIQSGTNTYTGGTSALPTVNVSALTISTLTASGNTSLATLSATTIVSGSTNLNNIFQAKNVFPSGMMVLLNSDEVGATGAVTNLSAVTQTVGANAITFTKYMIEADINFVQVANTNNEMYFSIWYNTSASVVQSRTFRADATGAGDVFKMNGHISYILTTTSLYKYGISANLVTGAPTWTITNFRIYGIV